MTRDKLDPKIVKRIKDLHEQGLSNSAIADRMHVTYYMVCYHLATPEQKERITTKRYITTMIRNGKSPEAIHERFPCYSLDEVREMSQNRQDRLQQKQNGKAHKETTEQRLARQNAERAAKRERKAKEAAEEYQRKEAEDMQSFLARELKPMYNSDYQFRPN